jgi:hypothetical protein
MRLTQRERTSPSPWFLVQRQQDLCELVAGVYSFRMGFEAITATPCLVVKRGIVPGEEFNRSIPQNEIGVIAFIWQPTLVLWEILASSSRHGSTTLCGRNLFIV